MKLVTDAFAVDKRDVVESDVTSPACPTEGFKHDLKAQTDTLTQTDKRIHRNSQNKLLTS